RPGLPRPAEQLRAYPLKPLVGELGFIFLRGVGFALVLGALQPIRWGQLLPILGAFSAAWLLGLVIPGAPGGLGVFEAVAVALLQFQLPTGQVLLGVLGYRLVSTLAEATGAGLIWLDHPSRGLAITAAAPLRLPPASSPRYEPQTAGPSVEPLTVGEAHPPSFSPSQSPQPPDDAAPAPPADSESA
ncbi:MAG: hypothetical protein AAFZ80_01335, partial [Cyanobacteria bacterium P01_A01_bin.105]